MTTNRRTFIQSAFWGSAALGVLSSVPGASVVAQEPIERTGSSSIRMGLAAYTYREYFDFVKGSAQSPRDGKKLDMFRFIDHCSELECGAELTSYYFPPDADRDYFLEIKRRAFINGVPIVGTAIGNNFTIAAGEELDMQIADAKKWIDRAAIMGAPHIRFFAGTRKQLESSPEVMPRMLASLQECVDYAAEKGVFVGVENHGGLTAAQVMEIVQGVTSDWFGVNLDTGNFVSDDPYRDLAICAPHAINVQVKAKVTDSSGLSQDVDIPRVAKILFDADYSGFVVLEFEEDNPRRGVPEMMAKMKKVFAAE